MPRRSARPLILYLAAFGPAAFGASSNVPRWQSPRSQVQHVKKTGKLPVVNFAAGGVATPADAALCMQLGVDGVFVGSGIFKSLGKE